MILPVSVSISRVPAALLRTVIRSVIIPPEIRILLRDAASIIVPPVVTLLRPRGIRRAVSHVLLSRIRNAVTGIRTGRSKALSLAERHLRISIEAIARTSLRLAAVHRRALRRIPIYRPVIARIAVCLSPLGRIAVPRIAVHRHSLRWIASHIGILLPTLILHPVLLRLFLRLRNTLFLPVDLHEFLTGNRLFFDQVCGDLIQNGTVLTQQRQRLESTSAAVTSEQFITARPSRYWLSIV